MRDWDTITEQVNIKINTAIQNLEGFREGLLQEIEKEKTTEMSEVLRNIDNRLSRIEARIPDPEEG